MNKKQGLYKKYRVERIDGKSDVHIILGRGDDMPIEILPDYFILKLNSGNPYEIDALETYALSCEKKLPMLAKDLFKKVIFYRKKQTD